MDEVVNENSREVLKMVCDMIILILTGGKYLSKLSMFSRTIIGIHFFNIDEAMDFLYNNGEGVVYKDMVLWLDSPDSDLQNAAILAIGNFARKDTHCIQMVNNEISKKILGESILCLLRKSCFINWNTYQLKHNTSQLKRQISKHLCSAYLLRHEEFDSPGVLLIFEKVSTKIA